MAAECITRAIAIPFTFNMAIIHGLSEWQNMSALIHTDLAGFALRFSSLCSQISSREKKQSNGHNISLYIHENWTRTKASYARCLNSAYLLVLSVVCVRWRRKRKTRWLTLVNKMKWNRSSKFRIPNSAVVCIVGSFLMSQSGQNSNDVKQNTSTHLGWKAGTVYFFFLIYYRLVFHSVGLMIFRCQRVEFQTNNRRSMNAHLLGHVRV